MGLKTKQRNRLRTAFKVAQALGLRGDIGVRVIGLTAGRELSADWLAHDIVSKRQAWELINQYWETKLQGLAPAERPNYKPAKPRRPKGIKIRPSLAAKDFQKLPKAERDAFYESRAWKELRYQAIKLYGRACQCCGSKGPPIHVDHIKPRWHHPELQYELSNLQILCGDCNLGKGAWDETDWRAEPESPLAKPEMAHLKDIMEIH